LAYFLSLFAKLKHAKEKKAKIIANIQNTKLSLLSDDKLITTIEIATRAKKTPPTLLK